MKKFILLLTLCSVAFSSDIVAQESAEEVNFSINISSDTVLMGNYIQVSFKLENARGDAFTPPSFEGFQVISGPNQSSSFSMYNGKVSQSISYSYYMKATIWL